ncbi:MAG: cyclic-di-AMP receptor [Anaerolineae bacterium]
MKLVVSIVNSDDSRDLVDHLTQEGFRATIISTTGGFLREGNATVLVGVEDPQVPQVLKIIRQSCHTRTQYVNPLPPVMEPGELYMPTPVEVQVGGATVFVLNVERFEKF